MISIPSKYKEEQYLIPIKIILVYVFWKIFQHYASVQGTALYLFWLNFCSTLGNLYAITTSAILSFFGMASTADGININLLKSGRQIWVKNHCLAIPASIVFLGSVIFFKGQWQEKIGFITLGMLGIILINLLRLVFTCIAWVYLSERYFELNHSFIYVVITYGFIFAMIAWWINRSQKIVINNHIPN